MASDASQQEPFGSPPTTGEVLALEATSKAETHEIQLRYKLSAVTLKNLCLINKAPDRRAVLEKACLATVELRSFPIKASEKAFFVYINDHTNIPYLLREGVSQPWHKAFLLIQIDLSKAGWPNKISGGARKELYHERARIYTIVERSLRSLIDIMGMSKDGRGVTVGLDVLRSLKAGVWEGAGKDLLQVEGIGEKKMEKLVDAGVNGVRHLGSMEFYHIERLLSRNPPFGQNLLRSVAGFPILKLNIDIMMQLDPTVERDCSLSSWIARIDMGYENKETPMWKNKRPWTTLVIEGEDGRLVWFWRGSVKRLDGGKELLVCLNASKGELLKVLFACEEVVGTCVRKSFRL